MTRKKKTPVDPTWPPVLRRLNAEVAKMDELAALRDKTAANVDKMVREAIDEGEKYRDIARAANRSVPWVQTVLRRLDIEGPRVRLISARVAEAKRLAEADRRRKPKKLDPLDDLMP